MPRGAAKKEARGRVDEDLGEDAPADAEEPREGAPRSASMPMDVVMGKDEGKGKGKGGGKKKAGKARGDGGRHMPQSSPLEVQPMTRAPSLASSPLAPRVFDAASPPAIRRTLSPMVSSRDVRVDYDDGSHYVGQVVRDVSGQLVRHGVGTLVDAVKRKTYVGEWVAGVKHGQGSTRYHDRGQMHHGEYCRGIRQGHGTLSFEGGVYVGDFALGKFHGNGTMRWTADGSQYEGTWDAGRMVGGTRVLPNGDRFEGAFDRAGRIRGFGIARFANGDVLEARFLDGLAQGRGRLQRASDGSTTWGDYRQGKPCGLQVVRRPKSTLVVLDGGWGARETERFCELGEFDVASFRLQAGSRFNASLCFTAESWDPLPRGIRTELRYDSHVVSCARDVDDDDGEIFLSINMETRTTLVDLGRGERD